MTRGRASIVATVLLSALAAGCTRQEFAGAAPPPTASRPHPRFGAVMAEVGLRFERAGRAASSGRFELAAFEVGELEELFSEDVPNAELPKEGTSVNLPGLASIFAKTNIAPLKSAAAAHDLSRFRDAFRDASLACTACHQASGHGFIEISPTLNHAVPNLEPASAPSP